MMYHFRVHREGRKFWAQGVELDGCFTQADTKAGLMANMQEALSAYLDEPENSRHIFPMPNSVLRGKSIVEVPVEAGVALAMLVRQSRVQRHLTQKQAAKRLGLKSLFSYQRLESSRTANPELSTLMRIKRAFPEFSADLVLG